MGYNPRLLLSMRKSLIECIHKGGGHTIYDFLLDFSLTVKAATLIFISGCGSAITSAKEGKSGFIYNYVKSY